MTHFILSRYWDKLYVFYACIQFAHNICTCSWSVLCVQYLTCACCGKQHHILSYIKRHLDRVKRIWYLPPMRAAKVQASLRIRAVSPEPSLLAHTSSESRGTFRQKARSLAPLNGWACAVKICHEGMLEDTNSLDGDHLSRPMWYVC